jgi:hypothetical protein
MSTQMEAPAATIGAEVTLCEEVPMVRRERWEEIRRLWVAERVPIAEIARRLDLDRKTVRRCLRDTAWQPYRRPARPETLLTPHAEYLRERAAQVDYSAQILFQELRQRGYHGSYEQVKLFVRPLRALRLAAERALIRLETPPGRQSQIDWGQARVPFRHASAVRHIFVLTLGFSRRSYYQPWLTEALPQFLDAHELDQGRRCPSQSRIFGASTVATTSCPRGLQWKSPGRCSDASCWSNASSNRALAMPWLFNV